MDHSHCTQPGRLKNHPCRAELAAGGWRIPSRVCFVGLEHCNLRSSLGLEGQPPCCPKLVNTSLPSIYWLWSVLKRSPHFLNIFQKQMGFQRVSNGLFGFLFVCSFFFLLRVFFFSSFVSCNEQSGNVLGKEPNLEKYSFSGASMDISEKILRITGNLNVGTQPRSRVEASPHLVVNLATEVKTFQRSKDMNRAQTLVFMLS